MQSRYHIIQTEKEVDRLIEACIDTKYACFDYETNARPIYCNDFYPTILSVSFQPGSGISLPLNHFDSPFSKPQWLRLLRKFGSKVISNPDITKVAWNWKFDQQINDLYGIYNKGRVLDGMLAKYLLDEERPNGLKEMVERYLPEFGGYQLENNLDKMPWDKKPLEPLSKYGCMDTDCTLRLTLFFESKLIELGLYPLYRNLLMMASRVLLSVEKTGLPFDVELNKELKIKYGDKIDKFTSDLRSIKRVKKYEKYTIENRKETYLKSLEDQIDTLRLEGKDRQVSSREQKISRIMAGEFTTNDEKKIIEPINFGSQKQMVDLLYNSPKGLNLPIIEYTKDKHNKPTKNPSTAEDTLVKLKEHDKHGFINSLLDLRGIQTINSTFIVGMGELVQSDNKVHPTFLIHGCVTGDTKLVCKESDIEIRDLCPKKVGNVNIEDKGIFILTHEGTWEQVTHGINKGLQKTYSIEMSDGSILKCTKEHKLLTTEGFKKVSYIIKHNCKVIMHDTRRLNTERKKPIGKKSEEIEFREIPGWPGYISSSDGNIFSLKVKGARGLLDYNHPHEIVKRIVNGRYRVGLRNNSGKKYMKSVSHLIWLSFNCKHEIPEGMVIDHIDCNPLNNTIDNLQCITYSDNTKRSFSNTRSAFTNGGINGMTKLDTLKVGNIKLMLSEGITQKAIVEEYDISQKQVSRIANGTSWSYIYLATISKVDYLGEKEIFDLSVNKNHSYITRSNFISSNTTSGRLSSRNPNGQNIPKTSVNPDVKKQFIAPPGELFFAYDYSQAELRILAHLAKEKTMLEWFRTGKDIHLASACKKYNEDYEEILKIYEDELHPRYPEWKVKRKQAKTINFGIVYEQSAAKLAEGLSTPDHIVTKDDAQVFLDDYFKTFPRIKKFMDKQHKFMENNGFCVSLFGRKRRCPKVYSESYREYLEALRQSTNMPCQSAASDMALFASILVWEEVKMGRLPPMKECTTVHDSVYQFIKPSYITPSVVYRIWDICRNPSTKEYFGFSIDDVDMSMDFSIGRVMAEELPYIPGYDYNKLLSAPRYGTEEYKEFKKEYFGEHAKTRDVSIKDYPKKFKQYFKEERMVWKQQ